MNLSRGRLGPPQYSRNITGSGRFTAICPSSPGVSTRAVRADHRDGHGRAPACRSRPASTRRASAHDAEHEIAFGLAVELVDGEAERRPAPFVASRRRAPRRPSRSVRSLMSCGHAGIGAERSIRSAVGGMKALRTPAVAHQREGLLGIELVELAAPPPARRNAGSAAGTSSSPPAQAQSAGVQNRSPACGKKSCGSSTPGRWPSSTRWPCSAPFGWPGGARGVDHHRRIVRRGHDRREAGRRARATVSWKPQRAIGLAPSTDEHEREVGQLVRGCR